MSEAPETTELNAVEKYGHSAANYAPQDFSWLANSPHLNTEFAYLKGWESPSDLVRDREAKVGPDQVWIPGGDARPTRKKSMFLVPHGPPRDARRVLNLSERECERSRQHALILVLRHHPCGPKARRYGNFLASPISQTRGRGPRWLLASDQIRSPRK
jgi:hypothetical protein